MSTVKSFSVGTMSVNASMPSALEQDEVLSIIGSETIQRAISARYNEEPMTDRILAAMFTTMPIIAKRRVADILCAKAFIAGTQTKVTVADFQGKMVAYNTLLAQLTLWNFEDFFTWLNSDSAAGVQPNPNEAAQ